MEKSISALCNADLIQHAKDFREAERGLLIRVIRILLEINHRKLYAQRGYPSLFEFTTKELRYDEGSAYRRISAMRAVRDVPEVEAGLASGELSLSNVNQVQSFILNKSKDQKVSLQEKRALFNAVKRKSKREAQQYLLGLNPKAIKPERIRQLSPEHTEIRVTLNKETMRKLARLRELFFHRKPNPSFTDLLNWMADVTLEKKDPLLKKTRSKSTSPAKVEKPRSRAIPSAVRSLVWKRDRGRCQYRDPETKKVCGSTRAIEIDHIHPYAKGGGHSPENLRLLCRTHNQFIAELEFG